MTLLRAEVPAPVRPRRLKKAARLLAGQGIRRVVAPPGFGDWPLLRSQGLEPVETAGLCLRCSPYIEGSVGVVVLEATSGMNLPRKIGPMLSLADVTVVTKIDLVSQAEREVFRARILEAVPGMRIIETDALYGIGIDPLVRRLTESPDVEYPLFLRGNPPVGTCTICVGKKEIGWKQHFGVVRPLDSEMFYRGE